MIHSKSAIWSTNLAWVLDPNLKFQTREEMDLRIGAAVHGITTETGDWDPFEYSSGSVAGLLGPVCDQVGACVASSDRLFYPPAYLDAQFRPSLTRNEVATNWEHSAAGTLNGNMAVLLTQVYNLLGYFLFLPVIWKIEKPSDPAVLNLRAAVALVNSREPFVYQVPDDPVEFFWQIRKAVMALDDGNRFYTDAPDNEFMVDASLKIIGMLRAWPGCRDTDKHLMFYFISRNWL